MVNSMTYLLQGCNLVFKYILQPETITMIVYQNIQSLRNVLQKLVCLLDNNIFKFSKIILRFVIFLEHITHIVSYLSIVFIFVIK